MKPQTAEVGQFFDKRAAAFDSLYDTRNPLERFDRKFLRRGLFERARLAVNELPAEGGYTVLDVGSGSGRNSMLFAEAGATEVLGVDLSPQMTALARQRAAASGSQICRFVEGDVMTYAFDRRFDAVVALGVFDYVEDPVAMLKRMRELATRQIIASFPQRVIPRSMLRQLRYRLSGCTVYFYEPAALESVCRSAGLTRFRLIPYPSGGLLLSAQVD